ncbi:MAG TPA: glycosyltransferase family 4 protein [Nitrososphaerales archaeon]|nr:glycosyltransferase family 4 protein [Nitrososphaerales archaeon]
MTLVIQVLHHTIRDPNGGEARKGWNEVVALQLAKRYTDLEIECWTPDSGARSDAVWRDAHGIVHRTFPSIRLRYGVELSPMMLGQARSMARQRPLLHLHGVYNLTSYAFSVLQGGRSPILLQFHDPVNESPGFPAPIRAGVRQAALRKVARFLVPSEGQRALLPAWMREKAVVSPLGVDLDVFHPLDKYAERARLGLDQQLTYGIFVGRLVAAKGLRPLLHAVQMISRKIPGFHLLVAGDGPMQGELEATSKSIGIGDRVHLLGWLGSERLASFLNAADMLIHPSFREAGPLAVLESLACGTPVIAKPVGYVPELSETIGGIVAIDGPLPSAIAEAIEAVGRDPLAVSAGIKRERIARYGWDEVSARLCGLYAELARQSG